MKLCIRSRLRGFIDSGTKNYLAYFKRRCIINVCLLCKTITKGYSAMQRPIFTNTRCDFISVGQREKINATNLHLNRWNLHNIFLISILYSLWVDYKVCNKLKLKIPFEFDISRLHLLWLGQWSIFHRSSCKESKAISDCTITKKIYGYYSWVILLSSWYCHVIKNWAFFLTNSEFSSQRCG